MILILISLILTISLGGCIETDDDRVEDNVEIVSYSIVTYKSAEEPIANGFVYQEDAKFYLVKGTAKNIGRQTLDIVTITVKFYDINNTFLREEGSPVFDVEKNYSWEFEIIYLNTWNYFEDGDLRVYY